MELNPEDWHDWKDSPVTQEYFRQVSLKIREHMISLGNGVTLNTQSADQTAIETAKAVGAVEALQDILDIEFIKE